MSTVELLQQKVRELPEPQQLKVLQFVESLTVRPAAEHQEGESAPEPGSPFENPRIVISPFSGLPVLAGAPGAPVLTSEMVREMLEDFP